jgi:hypothetical protein
MPHYASGSRVHLWQRTVMAFQDVLDRWQQGGRHAERLAGTAILDLLTRADFQANDVGNERCLTGCSRTCETGIYRFADNEKRCRSGPFDHRRFVPQCVLGSGQDHHRRLQLLAP